MKYYDAVALPSLQQKALSLGYAGAVVASKLELKGQGDIRKASSSKGVCLVSSSNNELLKKVSAHQGNATLLIDAYNVPNFYRDDGLIRAVELQARDGKKVAFAVPFSYLLRSSFVYRARFIAQTKLFLAKCIKRKAPFVIVSAAESEYELKSAREAIALGELFGLSFEQAQKALCNELVGE